MSSRKGCDAETHRQLVNELQSPAFVISANAVVEANEAALRLIGASREELPHVRFDAMFVEGVPEQLREAIAGSPRSAFHAQLRLRSIEGVEQEVSATVTPCAGSDRAASMHIIVTRSVVVSVGAEADHRYAELFDSSGDAILIVEPDSQEVLAANRRASDIYKVPVDELIGKPLGILIGGSTEQSSTPVECAAVRPDGTAIHLETSFSPITYRGRQALLAMLRDISARKQMQQIEQRFELFVNSVTEYAMTVLDRQGRIEAWNSGAERLTGYAANEAVGKHFSMFYPTEERAARRPHADLAAAARDSSSTYEGRLLRKDGASFYASSALTVMRDEAGNTHGFAWIVRDSTDRMKLEQDRAQLNATLELIAREWVGTFDAIDSPVILVDEEGAVRRLNRAAQKLAAVGFADILQRRLSALGAEPWLTADRLVQTAAQTGTNASGEATNGQRSWHLEATTAEFELMMRRTVIVMRETTETRRLEESLRQAEVASALGTMIAGVAHEVRRPLFQLSATVDACEARMGSNSEFQRYAPHLRSSVSTLSAIIRELLDYTRSQPLMCSSNAPSLVAREAVRQCMPASVEKGVSVTVSDNDAPAEAWYDAPRIAQVLQNIVENAIQHAPAGGSVNVSVKTSAETGVEFVVEDDGAGFTNEDLEHAVQAFYTRRSGGTGLGLAIVKKIVDAHGGRLRLSNRPGGGARVSVTLRQPRGAPALVSSS